MKSILLIIMTWLAMEKSVQAMQIKNNYLKVNNNGEYINFSGITVVAPASKRDEPFFQELLSAFQQVDELSSYYALLPLDSYHMTTNNLYSSHQKNWSKLMAPSGLKRFCALHETLENRSFTPSASLQKITVGTTLKLVLTIQDDHRKIITEIAEAHKIQDKIPTPFHVTLGYLYRDIPEEKLAQLKYALTKIVGALRQKYDTDFQFDIPRLCSFSDMKNFVPWNCQVNPFAL